jgi:hypothetical protein
MASLVGLRTAFRSLRPSVQLTYPLSLFGVSPSTSKPHHSIEKESERAPFALSWLARGSGSSSPFPRTFFLPFAIAAASIDINSNKSAECAPNSTPEDLRDAVMARYTGTCPARDVSHRFNGVHSRKVAEQLLEVEEMVGKAKKDDHPLASQMELERSSAHVNSKFVYRWVSHRCGATILRGTGHTELELK